MEVIVKLTDTQLVLLSAASQREDRGIVIPENLKGAVAKKVVAKLVQSGLIQEVRKTGSLQEWRREDGNGSFALIISDDGLQAIGVEPASEADGAPPTQVEPPKKGRGLGSAGKGRGTASPAAQDRDAPIKTLGLGDPRKGSKTAQLVALLKRAKGAGIDEVVASLGWLPHTTRAAITGLRKRGFTVDRQRSAKGTTIYRITAEPSPLASGVGHRNRI